jgi:hypothetical protein
MESEGITTIVDEEHCAAGSGNRPARKDSTQQAAYFSWNDTHAPSPEP